MREAIGGTMLMYIVMFFLIVYIFFMAVVINYGRVFRAKNGLISFIEEQEGFKSGTRLELIQEANDLGYSGDIWACWSPGNSGTKYFSIRLFINFELPLVDGSVKIPISGETSGIRNVSEDNTIDINPCGTGDNKLTKSTHRIR